VTARRLTAAHVWLALTVLVTVVWAANIVTPWITPAYHPDPSINSLFMCVVGGIVTLQVERAEHRRTSDKTRPQGDQTYDDK
jgi:hypothetical protein